MRFFLVALALVVAIGLGLLFAVARYGQSDLPSLARLKNIEPAVKTEVFDRNGRLIADLYRENRSYVLLKDIPPVMIDAVLAIEDRRFYRHWGLDVVRIAGAAFRNLQKGRTAQGGSTITQQLARNLFLTHEQTFDRKLKEQILALRIEQAYSKDEILELYLNQIYFGDGAYGVQSAARRFLGKDIDEVTLADAALLAGLPRNPRDYSPRRHPENALKRRRIVLGAMEDAGMIDAATLEAAASESIQVAERGEAGEHAPWFVEMVRIYLDEKYGSEAVYAGGLRVETTLDLELQAAAEEALARQLDQVAADARHRNRYQAERERPASVRDAPSGTDYIQGAALTIDARSGEILMMIGGRDYADSRFNRATQALRQPGSTFKPFIYLAALKEGHLPTETLVDEPTTYSLPDGSSWSPQNYDGEYSGEVTLREALARSINVPAVKLLDAVGPRRVIDVARACGISSRIPPYLSIALGSAEVTLQEIVYAYAVFANQGLRPEPLFVTRVVDKDGTVLEENRPKTREAFDAAPIYVLTDMLETVMTSGTGARARSMGLTVPVAGKSGTTNDYSDAWFLGYTPEIVTGVWVGFDERKPIGGRMSGSVAALPAWTDIMKAATTTREATSFATPRGVVFRQVCAVTGLLARSGCPDTRRETFVAGEEPTLECREHGGGLLDEADRAPARRQDGLDRD
jgi:1A family penicillin-binding protein